MGWCDESGEHEGYVAKLFADGLAGTWTSGIGVGVWPTGSLAGGEETRPYTDVVAWQVRCECGWRGETYPLDREKPDRWMEPDESRDDELCREWQVHAAPFRAVYRLADLANEAARIDVAIADAVDAARRAGASWSQIGRELGVTKQAAQQRYGN